MPTLWHRCEDSGDHRVATPFHVSPSHGPVLLQDDAGPQSAGREAGNVQDDTPGRAGGSGLVCLGLPVLLSESDVSVLSSARLTGVKKGNTLRLCKVTEPSCGPSEKSLLLMKGNYFRSLSSGREGRQKALHSKRRCVRPVVSPGQSLGSRDQLLARGGRAMGSLDGVQTLVSGLQRPFPRSPGCRRLLQPRSELPVSGPVECCTLIPKFLQEASRACTLLTGHSWIKPSGSTHTERGTSRGIGVLDSWLYFPTSCHLQAPQAGRLATWSLRSHTFGA